MTRIRPSCHGKHQAGSPEPEAGYSLVEATVALALLLTVLAPLSSFVVYLASQRRHHDEIVVLLLARQSMEATLYQRSFTSQGWSVQEGRWRVLREVVQEEGLVTVVIRVYPRNDVQPRVVLTTVRRL